MDDYLHPEGAIAVDGYGQQLLDFVGPIILEKFEDSFPSERHIAAALTKDDIVGELEFNQVDIAGRITRRVFLHNSTTHALQEDGCKKARDIAEKLLRMSKRLRAVAGPPFLEKQAFYWARDTYRGTTSSSLSSHLERSLSEAVKQQTIWFPLAGLEVETGFKLGPVHIKPVTADFFDQRIKLYAQRNPQKAADIEQSFNEMRREIQGTAAVVVTMEAEPAHAEAKGLELADAAAAILRIFSSASLTPWHSCACAVRGSEHLPRFTAIRASEDLEVFNWQDGIRDQGRYVWWRMSSIEAEAHFNAGLASAGELIADDGLDDFAHRLRSSCLTYARGLATADLNDRIVQTLSALEALLLKDSSESIQQNLGERMAFLIAKEPEKRLEVVRILKDAYRMRSQYVHHLVPTADAQALEEFVFAAHMTFRTALRNLGKVSSQRSFVEALDRMKFGG